MTPHPRPRPSLAALAAALGLALLLASCGGTTGTPGRSPGSSAGHGAGPTVVRWMVAGSGSAVVPPFVDLVRRYNEAGYGIHINLEVVPSLSFAVVLKSEIAAGNAPDIAGPIGERWLTGLSGLLLDLSPLLAGHHYDTRRYEPALASLFKDKAGVVGLPYLIYPAFMFYNKDLFRKAGLPEPPHRVGETYQGQTWDWNTVAEIARKLTLDAGGKHPGESGFDANKIVQFGFDAPWWDARRLASAFGAASFVRADGLAQIPESWREAWSWYYGAIWKDHFAPSSQYMNSVLACLGCGSTSSIGSGRVAMAATNTWTIDGYGAAGKAALQSWDMAVMPAWKGKTTGPLDADSFVILRSTAHPDEAFKVITAIMADKALQKWYGGMPAEISAQAAWFSGRQSEVDKVFPGNKVDWSVLQEMSRYPAIPSHDAEMPVADQVIKLYGDFFARLQSKPGLSVDAELARLQAEIQKAFDAALASPSG